MLRLGRPATAIWKDGRSFAERLRTISSSLAITTVVTGRQHTSRQPQLLCCHHRNGVVRFLSTDKAGTKAAATSSVSTTSKSTSAAEISTLSFWKRFLGPKPMPERWTIAWYREVALICTVFAITGSSTMLLVRPAVSSGLGLKGSMKDGPWSYRICSLVIMTPIYATLLVVVGTVFGRHYYFKHFSVKMWSRFGIPPEMLDESYHLTKKNFRKW